MKYIICQDWSNTTNNHAGMKYLANQLKILYPDEFEVIVIPDFYIKVFQSKNAFIRRLLFHYAKVEYVFYIKKLTRILIAKLKDRDSVFLFEYLEKMTPQLCLVESIKRKFPDMEINAIVHLTPQKLDKAFSQKEFEQWVNPISRVMTLGSSLTAYLIKRGIKANRISTTFHYVDAKYYHPKASYLSKDRISVIAMGNQMRNVGLLKKIVIHNPNVSFTICQGVADMSADFSGLGNVRLIPFVSENELKAYMEEADISLNVMVDTIGSNVIVTSMAMGLAMVCSDVGSIRDYCDETNTLFCNNEDEEAFSRAIQNLTLNPEMLNSLKNSSLCKVKALSIECFKSSLDK